MFSHLITIEMWNCYKYCLFAIFKHVITPFLFWEPKPMQCNITSCSKTDDWYLVWYCEWIMCDFEKKNHRACFMQIYWVAFAAGIKHHQGFSFPWSWKELSLLLLFVHPPVCLFLSGCVCLLVCLCVCLSACQCWYWWPNDHIFGVSHPYSA